jgi:hypothetical protein
LAEYEIAAVKFNSGQKQRDGRSLSIIARIRLMPKTAAAELCLENGVCWTVFGSIKSRPKNKKAPVSNTSISRSLSHRSQVAQKEKER